MASLNVATEELNSTTASASTQHELKMAGSARDAAALTAFKHGVTHDPSRALLNWNDRNHLCNWTGVECNTQKWRVIGLELRNMSLEGSIPSQLGNLSLLQILDLSFNRITGQIPAALGRLGRLKQLSLNRNLLEGQIPSSLGDCRGLTGLHLSKNKLGGSIPHQLGNLRNLQVLGSWGNAHTGIIPKALGNCSMLQAIDLSQNNLTGTIPLEIGFLTQLKQLILFENHLSGVIPPSILNCTQLRNLSLVDNMLSGPIPPEIGARLTELQWVLLSKNKLHGSIPMSFGNCSNLSHLELAWNEFTGIIPQKLGKLLHLADLNLFYNHFVTGSTKTIPILDALSNCSNLQRFDLSYNHLTGTLPRNIARLSPRLAYFSLEGNKLEGNIPKEIGNLTGLIELYLSKNSFVGSIPSAIGNLPNLHVLRLSVNKLEGNIPSEIGRMESLEYIYLYENKISGQIPKSLGNLQQLRELDLSINKLYGSIPQELGRCENLELLDLSYNNLRGAIPLEVANLRNLLLYLNLSNNALTGSLPGQLGGMQMVQAIDISANKLSNSIPNALGSCVELTYLNLSNNEFEGKVPTSIGLFLSSLEVIDLSSNKLSGPIPSSMSKLAMLRHMNFSYNNLSGPVPCAGAFRNMRITSFFGNPGLCGQCLGLPTCSSLFKRKDHKNSMKTRLVLIVSIVSAIFVLCCFGLGFWICFRNTRIWSLKTTSRIKLGPVKNISRQDLSTATEGFSPANLIGAGSYGSVYKGNLPGGKVVAIKVLRSSNRDEANENFDIESKTLSKVKHPNLVKIINLCSTPEFKALVLQFMPNGSLDKHLYWQNAENSQDGKSQELSLKIRFSILREVAGAISYLHHECAPPIVHCDLKPQNVLLDESMTAHVADFGIARLINASDEAVTMTSTLRGSIGYIAPEYGLGGRMSTKGDVYSYGVLLLEMITQKRPTDEMFAGGLTLAGWVLEAFPCRLEQVIEPALFDQITIRDNVLVTEAPPNEYSTLHGLAQVGLWCTCEAPDHRPTMREVEAMLAKITHANVYTNMPRQ
eukprot:Gb_34148 [translate_table: standard]